MHIIKVIKLSKLIVTNESINMDGFWISKRKALPQPAQLQRQFNNRTSKSWSFIVFTYNSQLARGVETTLTSIGATLDVAPTSVSRSDVAPLRL